MTIKNIRYKSMFIFCMIFMYQPSVNAKIPKAIQKIIILALVAGATYVAGQGARWVWNMLFMAKNVKKIDKTTTQIQSESRKAHQEQKEHIEKLHAEIERTINDSQRILNQTTSIKEDTSQIKQDTKSIQEKLNRIEKFLTTQPIAQTLPLNTQPI